jgi:hypothetical protein
LHFVLLAYLFKIIFHHCRKNIEKFDSMGNDLSAV